MRVWAMDGSAEFAGGFVEASTGLIEALPQTTALNQHEAQATVPDEWIDDAFPRLRPDEIDLALRRKIIPYAWIAGYKIYGVVKGQMELQHLQGYPGILGEIPAASFQRLVRAHLGQRLLDQAVHGLSKAKPWASAQQRLTIDQVLFLGLVFIIWIGSLLTGTSDIALGILMFAASLFFLMTITLRCICLLPLPPGRGLVAPPLPPEQLPIYTILVPLFRETAVLQQLVHALGCMQYPVDKLDIKLILEEGDKAMHVAVAKLNLPSHYDVIIVPTGKPQTKPRALNYAMLFARGSLVTIYDGEDIPEPSQLRLAAAQFAVLDDGVGCLQAALDFFNPNENWLTRQFAAEYAGLFHVILPTLAAFGLPLPLGGTSNHFRADALKAVGGWDAFNVTEDADLGIRLARHGFSCGVLDSTTLEEANTRLPNWMRQRRRWLKGFLQTWLVHMREPVQLLKEVGLGGFLTVQATTIGVFASALLHPILLLHALWTLMPAQMQVLTETAFGKLSAGMCFSILVAGYGFAIATNLRGLKRIRVTMALSVVLTFPIYWMMMSCAAWMALWDLIVAPYHWHKTEHGLTGLNKPSGRTVLKKFSALR